MVNPEVPRAPEAQADREVSFSGDDLVALEVFLYESRYVGRNGPDYFRLVDMHNAVRETLDMEPMAVHPDFQEEYDRYRIRRATQT